MSNSLLHDEESVDLYSEFMGGSTGVNEAQSPKKDLFEATNPKQTDSACPEQDGPGEVGLDLFTEVLREELQQKCDARVELSQRCAAAETRVQELEVELKTIREQEEKNRAQNEIVKKNISSLLLTAKTELKRKDRIISGLKLQLARKKYVPSKRPIQGHDDCHLDGNAEENVHNTRPGPFVTKSVCQKETNTSIVKRKRSDSEHDESSKRIKLSSPDHSGNSKKQNGFHSEGNRESTPHSKRKNQKESSSHSTKKGSWDDNYESNSKEKENKHQGRETNGYRRNKDVGNKLIFSKSRKSEGKDVEHKRRNGDIRERKDIGSKDRAVKATDKDGKSRQRDHVITEKAHNLKGKDGGKEKDSFSRKKDHGSRERDQKSSNEGTSYRTKKRHQSSQGRDHGSKERDRSKERDHSSRERDHSSKERDHSAKERDRGSKERDHSAKERDRGSKERDHSRIKRDHGSKERDRYKESSGHENRVRTDTVEERSRHSSGRTTKNGISKNTGGRDLRDILKKKRAGVDRVEEKINTECSDRSAGESRKDHSQEMTKSDSGKTSENILDEINKLVVLEETSVDDKLVIDLHPQSDTCPETETHKKQTVDKNESECPLSPSAECVNGNLTPSDNVTSSVDNKCQAGPGSESDCLLERNEINREHVDTGDTAVSTTEQTVVYNTVETENNRSRLATDDSAVDARTDALTNSEDKIKIKPVMLCDKSSLNSKVQEGRGGATHEGVVTTGSGESARTEKCVTEYEESSVSSSLPDGLCSENSKDKYQTTETEEKEKINTVMLFEKSLPNLTVTEQSGRATDDSAIAANTNLSVKKNESPNVEESFSGTGESDTSASLPDSFENRKERRRIKPVMLCDRSGLNHKFQEQSDGASIDSVIRNIEVRQKFEFANAKVVHIDRTLSDTECSDEIKIPVVLPKAVPESSSECSLDKKNEAVQKYIEVKAGNNCEGNKEYKTCNVGFCVSPEVKDESLSEGGDVHMSASKESAVYCREENERLLVCTPCPHSDKSSFSLCSELTAESASSFASERNCSPEMLMAEETCSRTSPYSSQSVVKESGLGASPTKHHSSSHKSECKVITGEKMESHDNCGSNLSCNSVELHDTAKGSERELYLFSSPDKSEVASESDILSSHPQKNGTNKLDHKIPPQDNENDLDGPPCKMKKVDPEEKVEKKGIVLSLAGSEDARPGILCLDGRLESHPKTSYHVEPFEFSSFPQSYAKTVVSEENTPAVENDNDSLEEQMEVDGSPRSSDCKQNVSSCNIETDFRSPEKAQDKSSSPNPGDCKQKVLCFELETMSNKSLMNSVVEVETELCSPDKEQDKGNIQESDDFNFKGNVSSCNSENMSDKSLMNNVDEIETDLSSPVKEQDKGTHDNQPQAVNLCLDDMQTSKTQIQHQISMPNSETPSKEHDKGTKDQQPQAVSPCLDDICMSKTQLQRQISMSDNDMPLKEQDKGTQDNQPKVVSPCFDEIHKSQAKVQRQTSMPNSETPPSVAYSVTPRTRSKSESQSTDNHNDLRIPDKNSKDSLREYSECQPIDLSVKPQGSASLAVSRHSSTSKHNYISGFCVSYHGALDLSQKSRKGDQYQNAITDTPHVTGLSIHSQSDGSHNGPVGNSVMNSISVCVRNSEGNESFSAVKASPAAEPDIKILLTDKDSTVDSTTLEKKSIDRCLESPTSSHVCDNVVSIPKDESTEGITKCSRRNSSEYSHSMQSDQCTEVYKDGKLCQNMESKSIVIQSVTLDMSVKSSDEKMSCADAKESNAACLSQSKTNSSCPSEPSRVPSQESSCSITTSDTKPSSSMTDSPQSQNDDKATDTSDAESLVDVCVDENENAKGFDKDCLNLSKAISDDVLRNTLAADLDLSDDDDDDDSCSSKAFSLENLVDKKGLEFSEPRNVSTLPPSAEPDASQSVASYKIDSIVSPDATSTGFAVDHDESSTLSIIEENSDFDLEQGGHGDYFKSPRKRDHSHAEKCSIEPPINDDSIEEGEVCGLDDSLKGSPEDSVDLQELLKEKELLEKKIRDMRSSRESSSISHRHDPRGKFEKHRLEREGRYSHVQKSSPRERKSSSECYRYSREIHGSDPRLGRSSRSSRDSESRHRYSSPPRDDKRERFRDRSPPVRRSVYRETERRPSGDRRDRHASYETRHHDRSRDGDRMKSRSSLHYHSSRRDSRS